MLENKMAISVDRCMPAGLNNDCAGVFDDDGRTFNLVPILQDFCVKDLGLKPFST